MEYFDLEQTIGRGSYFFRNVLIVILLVALKFIVTEWTVINGNPTLILVTIIIGSLFLSALSFCTSVKRARDLGGSGYFIGGTLICYLLIIIAVNIIPSYHEIFLLRYLDIISQAISYLVGLQGLYLLIAKDKIF